MSSPFFRVCLCSAVIVLLGCSEKKETVVEAAPEPEAVIQGESIVDGGDTKETARLWSDTVKAQLAAISSGIGTDGAEMATLFGDTFDASDLQSLESTERYEGQAVKVVELSAPETLVTADPGSFLQNLGELLCLSANDDASEAHFKLYGIDSKGWRLTTRQRLMSQGIREGHRVRSYGVVDAVWELPDGDEGGPRLLSFSMPALIQNELVSESAMFEDVAASVLGKNAAWSEQLQLGMNTWRRNLDRSLSPDFLGYHGVAIADVDGDDLEDVYLCQPGGLPNLLLKQQADGTLVDISKKARVDWLDNTTAALLVDLDNDGDKDLALATRTAFLISENNGKGRFSLRERLSNLGSGYSPTAADYDLDGDLDFLILRYASDNNKTGDFPTPHPFHSARNGGANVLLQNQGDFGFLDVTDDAGLGVENYRFSFAASWEDFDNDGDLDVYIANDFGPNQLMRNEGTHFIDESSGSGSQDWGFGMSATWGDYDRDGAMDLYVSSMFSSAGNQIVAQSDFNPTMPEETRKKYLKMVRGNSLMRNAGGGRFHDVTNPTAEGFAGWAWGSKFADLNNDGWEDLYVANGYISQPDTEDL
ncbi:VCBS repeat-containing protein [Verrucomicrobiales bacterium]|nr:VCBS repeat-containing protein [Verrucomicrobiales bacterium]